MRVRKDGDQNQRRTTKSSTHTRLEGKNRRQRSIEEKRFRAVTKVDPGELPTELRKIRSNGVLGGAEERLGVAEIQGTRHCDGVE